MYKSFWLSSRPVVMLMGVVMSVLCLLTVSQSVQALTIKQWSSPKELTQLEQKGELVVLHFYASWCPICVAQEKAFKAISTEDAKLPGTVLVVNVDMGKSVMSQYNVKDRSIIIIMRGGKEKARLDGETDKAKILAALKAA